jgi:adenosylcobinamide-phosphate synthase
VIQTAFVALTAVLLDRLLGEPRRFHPLVGFGQLASGIERALYGGADAAPRARRWHGGVALALAVLPLVIAAWWVAAQSPWVGAAAETALLYLALGRRSLEEHARRVVDALEAGALEEARRRVADMVSRDTGAMTSEEVARGAVESVLENGNDAVFGALFWYALAGAPGVVLYRLANTLDALWGYCTPRYLHFGWAAARLDDGLNYLPARLTALTYAALGRFEGAIRCWRAQGAAWESPNAGPVMAAGAGALGVKLGGPARYHGALKMRPALGEGKAPSAADIARATALVRRGTWLWLCVLMTGAWIGA